MGSEVIILPIIFGVLFGMFYLYISARNRERLALIEKGGDASIFYSSSKRVTPIWKVIVLNLGLLLMGIGIGIFFANILTYNLNVDEDVAFPGTIFLMAGISLLVGFFLTKRLNKDA
ncbi:hypothetical protein BC962_2780 [Gillisia mitskevichiae]|uniref:DUF6249 domain-containing protein n=1 Tax=Gillisia mitskevichiae TaxID=270921 RepID=A0A495P544_9FLAO|nr:DUF6249 domain-containing protein [Gillisia mitskevichiae]RKS45105.1 hypothetical protein BC962_2780 [Gillisia mitskevichiae]